MANSDIPPKPQRPDPNECCGGGCVPCVYDYYYDQLEKWHQQHADKAGLGEKDSTDRLKG